MPSPVQRCSRLAFVLLAAACSGYWGHHPLDQPTPVRRDRLVVIWTRGGVEKWHGVVITQDSVSGIPYDIPVECEHDVHWAWGIAKCRRVIPRVQVDSMNLYYRTLAQNVTETVGIFAVLTLAEGVMCYLFDRGDPQC